MNTAPPRPRHMILFLCLAILAACQPPSPTPIAQDNIQIVSISVNDPVTGQIIQTKTFDQCDANSSVNSEVKFGEGRSETTEKELTLSEGVGAEVEIPLAAKAKLEVAVEERFSVIKQSFQSHEESVAINVPAHTRQEYTIVWKETRHEGTIEYTVNGVSQFANYSYRVGLEFVSAKGSDIDCSLPTATPAPTNTPRQSTGVATPTPQPKTLADGCIFSKTWKPDAPNANLLDSASIGSDGCYAMEELGIFVNRGKLHLFNDTRNNTISGGIYTPINSNSVIEFNIYVTTMSMRFDNVAEVVFAVAPANDRLTTLPTTRFKLHLEDAGTGKVIHFMMADSGEHDGVKLGTQHYEYGNIYNIRLELSGKQMDVYINGYQMKEHLKLPAGAKVFYIGYTLPVYSEMNIDIGNISVDGLAK